MSQHEPAPNERYSDSSTPLQSSDFDGLADDVSGAPKQPGNPDSSLHLRTIPLSGNTDRPSKVQDSLGGRDDPGSRSNIFSPSESGPSRDVPESPNPSRYRPVINERPTTFDSQRFSRPSRPRSSVYWRRLELWAFSMLSGEDHTSCCCWIPVLSQRLVS